MNGIARLQQFFVRQCDGDWEHGHGISITTLDNPGWSVKVDIEGFEPGILPFAPLNIERSQTDWVHLFKDHQFLHVCCGAGNLEEGLDRLLHVLEEWEK